MNFFLILSRILVGKADINSQKKSHFNLFSLNPIQPEAKTSLRCCVVQSSDKISTFHISFKQVRNFNIPGMMPLVERCVEGQNFIIYDRMTVQLKETRCTKLCCTAVLPYHYTLTHQGSQNQKLQTALDDIKAGYLLCGHSSIVTCPSKLLWQAAQTPYCGIHYEVSKSLLIPMYLLK